MIKKSTLLFLLVLTSYVFAQNYDWNWKNPTPFGNSFNSGVILPPNTLIGIGDAGIVIKSTDGGATGTHIYVDGFTGRTLNDIEVVGTNLFVCGSGGLLLKSTDIGDTWIALNSGVTSTLYQLAFVDNNVGYVVGAAGLVLKTTDAGITWVTLPAPTAQAIYAIDIVSSNNIYIGCARTGTASTGYSKMLMKTTDEGNTWLDVSATDMATVRGVDFIDANNGWVCVQSLGKVFYTTDGGTTWASSTTASLVVPNFVKFINNTTGFVTNNNNGQIFKTTDGGATWVANTVGTEPFYQVAIAGNTMMAFGRYGSLYLSSDLGTNWLPVINAITRETLRKVYFADNTGYACGGSSSTADLSGFMLKSEDGGNTWAKLGYNFNFQVYSFFIQSPTVWYVGTGDNKLFKTTDGGLTFSQLTQPVTGTTHDFNAIEFADANTGYAAGTTGKIIKTTDAGANWTLLTFPSTSTINDIKVLDANTVIAAVGATSTYKTTDGGATWNAVNLGYTAGTIYDLEFYNNLYGVAAGYNSPSAIVSLTTDSGITWSPLPSLASFTGVTNLRVALIKDVNTWWLADLNGNIAFTKDAGVTWTQAKKVIDHGIYGGAFNNQKLYFVGSGGTILQGF
ncbi:MAG TPA: YCF48-related protein, partial [Melioribacteraceae bacterium]|nr:YCF48-related protein [Melioribacteraceae bacterium]